MEATAYGISLDGKLLCYYLDPGGHSCQLILYGKPWLVIREETASKAIVSTQSWDQSYYDTPTNPYVKDSKLQVVSVKLGLTLFYNPELMVFYTVQSFEPVKGKE